MIHSKIVPNNNKKNVVEIFIKELLLRLLQDIIGENISVRSTHEIRINIFSTVQRQELSGKK